MTPQMIRTQLAGGRLVRVRRGVFVAASAWPEDEAGRHLMRARAELVTCPDAVLSHGTAALVWGLPHPGLVPWEVDAPTVSEPLYSAARSRSGPVVHHLARLPLSHITRDESGYRVTTLARTGVDLAAGRALPEALVLLDAAARQMCASMVAHVRRGDYVNAQLVRAARELLSEAATVRRAISLKSAISLTEPSRESAAESLSAGHFEIAGLPIPLFQHPIRTPYGTYYPDFYWPEQRLIGECDGAVKYENPDAIVLEKRREQALRDQGERFVRWMALDIMLSPAMVVGRVARALGL